MNHCTFARRRAALALAGLLGWSAIGCQSETSTPDVAVSAVPAPGPADALAQDASAVVGKVDANVQQTAQTVENRLDPKPTTQTIPALTAAQVSAAVEQDANVVTQKVEGEVQRLEQKAAAGQPAQQPNGGVLNTLEQDAKAAVAKELPAPRNP